MGTNKNDSEVSMFIRIPNEDNKVIHVINTDHVVEVLLDNTTLYITMKKDDRYTIEFETPEEGRDFIDKNFILFNS